MRLGPSGRRLLSSAANGVKPQTQSQRLPRVIGEHSLFENAWLRLKRIRFLDLAGRERHWTGIERTTTYPKPFDERHGPEKDALEKLMTAEKEDRCDAVVVFPFLIGSDAHLPVQVILIRQFRPTVGKWVVELPAGLIDADETPEAAASRELREETGFTAWRVLHMGPPMVNDQGITNGKCRLLLMEVHEAEQDPNDNEQHLEQDEMIQVVRAPLKGLIPWLLDQQKHQGDAIDARLYSYALGLQALPVSILQHCNTAS